MSEKSKSHQELVNEIMDLRNRLEEAQETLLAISRGEVDAFVVANSDSMQTVTLRGAHFPYRVMVESMGEGAATLSPDGTILYCNPRLAEIVQTPLEKLIGTQFQDLIPPNEQEQVAAMIKISGKNTAREEVNLQIPDGILVPVQLSAQVLQTEETEAVTLVVTDLTERKQAEQTLREGEHKLSEMFQSMVDGMIVVDLSGEITYANPAAESTLGIEKDQIIGKYYAAREWKQIDADGKPISPDQLPLAVALREKREVINLVHAIHTSENVMKWLSVNASPLVDESGHMYGAIASFRDITEQKKGAEALLKLHDEIKFQASLLDQARNAVIATDLDGKIVFWNKFAETLYQWEADEAIGKSIQEVTVPELSIEVSQDIMTSIQQLGYWEGDFNVRRKDGSIFPAHVVDTVFRDSMGTVIGIIGVSNDISERKQAEEEIRSRTQELQLLYEFSRALAEAENLDQILEHATHYTVEKVGITFSRITLLESGDLVTRAAFPIRGLDHSLGVGEREPLVSLPYCQHVLNGHEPVIVRIGDKENISPSERKILLLDYIHSLCLVPLRVGETGANSGRVLGLMMLGEARNETREPITLQKLNLFRNIGDQTASAIRRMLFKEETERGLLFLHALDDIDRAITSSFEMKNNVETVVAQVINQLKVDAASILVFNPGTQTLEFFSGQGFRTQAIERSRLHLGESHAGRVALERIIVHVSNLKNPSDALLTSGLEDDDFIEYFGAPLISKGQIKGVLEIFNRTSLKPNNEWFGFLKTLAERTAIAIDNAMLFNDLTSANIELSVAYNDTIEGWSRALDLRDRETEGHSMRVTENTLIMARSFGFTEDELVQIRWGSLLHDIGKMGIPDRILLKPGPLTDEEWVLMKKHPVLAYDMLSPIHYLHLALDIPYSHHEKWDGTGYPQGLKGEQIPLAARIFAILDVWDALRSDRPYRPAWSEEKALAHIQSQEGIHFDPLVLQVFLESLARFNNNLL
jgi:PAS domain S-box-containing protein